MTGARELLERLYDRFNARDMEPVLAAMHEDVVWANGMEGGHVHGRAGVRDYWTRQWAAMDSRAEPTAFSLRADGRIEVAVRLSARDRAGNVLFDTAGTHLFRIEDGLIRRFDIG